MTTETDIYGKPCDVKPVRMFRATNMEMGVGFHETAFFVYDREVGDKWHLHCGPYRTREEGEWWINQIHEEPVS